MKVRNSDVLAKTSREDRAMKKYCACAVHYYVQFKGITEQ
jgi:hypothetical protein